MGHRSALVVASGALVSSVKSAPEVDLVIAADQGLEVATAAGRLVDVVVGDLDSASAEAIREAEAAGVEIRLHTVDKDESDLELALALAVEREVESITVMLRDGGRLDHQLANLLVLASSRWAAATIDAVVGDQRVWVVRGVRTLALVAGEPLALHAVGGAATGVTTRGLRFSLRGAQLEPLVALGIANEVTEDGPVIEVTAGVVLAISSPKLSSDPGDAR